MRPYIFALSILIVASGAVLYWRTDIAAGRWPLRGVGDALFYLVGLLFVWPFVAIPVFLVALPLYWIVRKQFPAPASAPSVETYKRACAAFDEWWNRTQREFWRSLSGRRFEIELAALFNRLGWQARPTPASNDGGIDVELFRGGTRTIVQCKAHAKPVGPAVVRELFGALAASEARSAMVASLSGFSPGARAFALEHGVELIDLEWILAQQKALQVRRSSAA